MGEFRFTHPYHYIDFIGCFFIGRVREGNTDKILLRHNKTTITIYVHETEDERSHADVEHVSTKSWEFTYPPTLLPEGAILLLPGYDNLCDSTAMLTRS